MRRRTLIGSTALGIVAGGVLFKAPPVRAQMATIDVAAIAQAIMENSTLSSIGSAVSDVYSGIQDVNKALSSTGAIASSVGDNTYGSVQQILVEGFTQISNYAKAQIGAQEQYVDASNTAMARFQRDMRNAQIRDEQTPSPTACSTIDDGVSTQAAAVQAYGVGAVIGKIHDLRGEAAAGMPSHFGQAQAVASMAAEHNGLYCNDDDNQAGLCPNGLGANPNADQQMLSLFGAGTYADQAAVNAAKDYAINLIEPLAPAALRGDQLTSIAGQDAAVRRRSYNARMSLAQSFVDRAIGMQTPSVPLTALQAQYLQNMGRPAQANGSWLQVLQIESERRSSDITWNANLQSMPPASVARETASELALTNYLLFQIFKMNLMHATIGATQLAEDTDRNFVPTVQMPTPSMVAN